MAPTRQLVLGLLLLLATSCSQLTAEPSEPVAATVDNDVVIEDVVDEPDVKAATYKSPEPAGPALLAESFDDKERFEKTWIKSMAKKEDIDEDIAKYDGDTNDRSVLIVLALDSAFFSSFFTLLCRSRGRCLGAFFSFFFSRF